MNATLEEHWQEYYRLTYPDGTPDVQRDELKQAFFAACLVSLGTVLMLNEESKGTSKFKEGFDKLWREANLYCKRRIIEMDMRDSKQN